MHCSDLSTLTYHFFANCSTESIWLIHIMIAKHAPIGSPKPCINAKKNRAGSASRPSASKTFAFCCVCSKVNLKLFSFCYSQSTNGEYKALNNGGDMRTGRDNYEVPKCCDNIVKTPTELSSPMSRCVPRFRDDDMIECQYSVCGCNFRAADRSQLIVHNEENIHRHMNVSVRWENNPCDPWYATLFVCVPFHLDDDVAYNKDNGHKRHKVHVNAIDDKSKRSNRDGQSQWIEQCSTDGSGKVTRSRDNVRTRAEQL